ncbi:uncharacterized protein TRIADDRAFT_60669 [Trichoplax adhaerens]|uniref:Death domain-containing protein n=1 Tax=Trichoplax adhaerens TaxID=10228 RepID=B3S921_TRIAD|nr:predicted protein [Trichoplax adhaerens]EDV20720.1 predicted protein [Trichoplax adhaerens]|eukprot:XP_002116661.1 predicted protein [Trichoplax adhaerens]
MEDTKISSKPVKVAIRNFDDTIVDVTLTYPNSPANFYFEKIIDECSANWKKLGRKLNIDHNQLEIIDVNNRCNVTQQCTLMLQSHYQRSGSSFTKLELIKALYLAGCRATAEKIQSMPPCKTVAISANTNDSCQDRSMVDSVRDQDISEYFFVVAQELKSDWTKLADMLDQSKEIDITRIQDENETDFDRTHAFLEKWKEIYKDEATKRRLKAALQAIRRPEIASMIDKQKDDHQNINGRLLANNKSRTSNNPIQTTDSTASKVNDTQGATNNYNPIGTRDATKSRAELRTKLSNQHFRKALEYYWKTFIDRVPAEDSNFLNNLRQRGILSDRQITEIEHTIHKSDKSQKIYDILSVERDVEDFIRFCQALGEYSASSVQNFAKDLELKAYGYTDRKLAK